MKRLLLLFLFFPILLQAQMTPWIKQCKRGDVPNYYLQCVGNVWTAQPGGPGGSGAPADASYWTRVAETGLSDETAMGALGTGFVVNHTTTGVPTIYGGDSCTNQVITALNHSGAATCSTITSAFVDTSINTTAVTGGTVAAHNFVTSIAAGTAAPTGATIADGDVPDTITINGTGNVSQPSIAANYIHEPGIGYTATDFSRSFGVCYMPYTSSTSLTCVGMSAMTFASNASGTTVAGVYDNGNDPCRKHLGFNTRSVGSTTGDWAGFFNTNYAEGQFWQSPRVTGIFRPGNAQTNFRWWFGFTSNAIHTVTTATTNPSVTIVAFGCTLGTDTYVMACTSQGNGSANSMSCDATSISCVADHRFAMSVWYHYHASTPSTDFVIFDLADGSSWSGNKTTNQPATKTNAWAPYVEIVTGENAMKSGYLIRLTEDMY